MQNNGDLDDDDEADRFLSSVERKAEGVDLPLILIAQCLINPFVYMTACHDLPTSIMVHMQQPYDFFIFIFW